MRFTRVLLAVGCLLSAAPGQWLGEKLSLLDTFGIPAGRQSLAYNNRNHTVYVSGDESDSILVIDADRCKSIARVAVGGPVRAMCYNPAENKLYCAYAEADTVVAFDGTSLQILAWIGVGDSAGTICYDSIDNKMYVGNQGSSSVSVIGCADDHLVATIDHVRGGYTWLRSNMCFVVAHTRVYVTSPRDSSVVAIDCSADTVLARIPAGRNPRAVCYNPTNDRVYCAAWGDSAGVYGIDARTNHVVSVVPRFGATLACDPARNVLFVPDDMLAVVDCSTDTVLAEVELPEASGDLVGYDPVNDKVYVAGGEPG